MARPRRRSNRPIQKKGPEHRINERIRVPEIRLVGDNVEQGVIKTSDALRMAYRKNLDLVEIAPNARPPVCRIIDYSKFLYEKKRKEKEIKAKAQKTVVKEIRFTPNTDDHDFEFKLKHATRFLEEGAKVKAYVQFKGRAIVFKERGELLLLKFAERLSEIGALEQMPRLEGKRMFAFISPKKSPKKKTIQKEKPVLSEDKKTELEAKKATQKAKVKVKEVEEITYERIKPEIEVDLSLERVKPQIEVRTPAPKEEISADRNRPATPERTRPKKKYIRKKDRIANAKKDSSLKG